MRNFIESFRSVIRPSMVLFFGLLFTIMMFVDGNLINIKKVYVDSTTNILMLLISFYFTSRGIEKITEIKSKKTEDGKEIN